MQNWGEASWGNLGDVRVADVMPVNCNKQEPCYGSTIKISLNPFWVWARKCIVPQIFLDHKRFANDPERTWTEIIPCGQLVPVLFLEGERGKITGQRLISRGQIKNGGRRGKKTQTQHLVRTLE